MKIVKGLESFNRRHTLPAVLLFVLLTVAPLAMAVQSLYPFIISIFTDKAALMALGYRLLFACACTLTSIVLALPGAYIFARLRFPLKGLLKAFCLLCFTVPLSEEITSIEIIESLTGFKPPFGYFNSAAALVFTNVPLAILIISSYWRTIDDSITDSARTLGVGRFHIFRTVTLPYLRCAIRGSASVVFIRCLAFGLSGKPLLAFILSLPAVGVFCRAFFGCRRNTQVRAGLSQVRPGRFLSHVLLVIYSLFLLCITLAGPGMLLYRVLFSEGSFSAAPYTSLFASIRSSGFSDLIGPALILAGSLIATVIASRLVFATKFMGFPVFFILVCLASGQDLVQTGYQEIMALLPGLPDFLPIILAETTYLIPIASVVMLPRFRSADSDLPSVATTLGSKAGRAFRTTVGRLLLSCEGAAFLICSAIMLGSLDNRGPVFTSVLTAISFIMLLVGSSLLRKVHDV